MADAQDDRLRLLPVRIGEQVQRSFPDVRLRGKHEEDQKRHKHHRHDKRVNRPDTPHQILAPVRFLLEPDGRKIRLRLR